MKKVRDYLVSEVSFIRISEIEKVIGCPTTSLHKWIKYGRPLNKLWEDKVELFCREHFNYGDTGIVIEKKEKDVVPVVKEVSKDVSEKVSEKIPEKVLKVVKEDDGNANVVKTFVKELVTKQKDLPDEFAKIVNDNFDKLIDDSKDISSSSVVNEDWYKIVKGKKVMYGKRELVCPNIYFTGDGFDVQLWSKAGGLTNTIFSRLEEAKKYRDANQ